MTKSRKWQTIGLLFCIALGCSDVTDRGRTLTVRGTVATGARTRTAVAGGYIELLRPGSTWTQRQFAAESEIPNKAVTNTDGTYTFSVSISSLEDYTDRPWFIAASNAAGTLTMLSMIPINLAETGAELQLDVNPTTTATALLHCPGGVYPPPSGAYCYEDPNGDSSNIQAMNTAIDNSLSGTNVSLQANGTANWASFLTTLLSDAALYQQLLNIVQTADFSTTNFTPSAIPGAVTTLPYVTAPATSDNNAPSSDSDDDSSDSGGCECNDGSSCTNHSDCNSEEFDVCGCPVGVRLFDGSIRTIRVPIHQRYFKKN